MVSEQGMNKWVSEEHVPGEEGGGWTFSIEEEVSCGKNGSESGKAE